MDIIFLSCKLEYIYISLSLSLSLFWSSYIMHCATVAKLLHARCWPTRDTAKGTTLSPISVCFISRCCCFFKRKKKKSGRQKWLSVTFGLGGAVQCAGNSAEPEGTTGTRGGAAVAATSRTGKSNGAGTCADDGDDPEREAVTLLRVGSRSASRDSVLHTTVTMTPTPTPPPLSNWWTIIVIPSSHGHSSL